jgi:hypothetical protein
MLIVSQTARACRHQYMKLAFEVNLHILSNRRNHPATARLMLEEEG